MFLGRYSPVRRASEGSKSHNHYPLHEYQLLQKGLAPKTLAINTNSTLLDNSISLPGIFVWLSLKIPLFSNNLLYLGSPIHGGRYVIDDRDAQEIEIPQDVMITLISGLERLVAENCITLETANQIIYTHKVPMELAQHLGLLAHSGVDGYSAYQQQQASQNISPIGCSYRGNGTNFASSNASPNFSGHFSCSTAAPTSVNSQNIPGLNIFNNSGTTNSTCGTGPTVTSFSGTSSPNPYYGNSGGTSPMHQITKGISGLTTGGGSITRGTSAACDTSVANFNNQPLDLSMDLSGNNDSGSGAATGWYVPAQFYDLKPLNLSPAQQVRIIPTPPTSPNLCIIREENTRHNHRHQNQPRHHSLAANAFSTLSPSSVMNTNEDANFPHSHPQICLTDVQGSEITLVALSDATLSSRDSDDSLEGHSSITLQDLIITEPANDMPSITKGVGRKSSLEIEHIKQQCHDERRGSDKSLGFSDDSLSNDSNILSPSQEPSASSGFKSGGDSHSDTCCDHTRLSPDSLSDSRMSSAAIDEYYELPLPHECSNLDSTRILEMVKQTIDSKMPPKGFVLHKVIVDEVMEVGGGSGDPGSDMPVSSGSVDISNLSLEYSGGLQIELQVCNGRSKNNSASKGIKLRRISGDQFEYGKLCQQLISSLTV